MVHDTVFTATQAETQIKQIIAEYILDDLGHVFVIAIHHADHPTSILRQSV